MLDNKVEHYPKRVPLLNTMQMHSQKVCCLLSQKLWKSCK